MKVGVVGSGYVGSVTAAGFAETGNDVTAIDKKPEIVDRMSAGRVDEHIYEPGLQDLVRHNIAEGRLRFTTDYAEAIVKRSAEVVFLAVPTPQGEDDEADLSYVLAAAKEVASIAVKPLVLVDKSTVPVGTAVWVREVVSETTDVPIAVVSNPEFLREGSALDDFNKPDQIVVGAEEEWAAELMRQLYEPFVRTDEKRFDLMDPASAEVVKYGINAFLATKISFANQLAQFCRETGADYGRVRAAIGRDRRIGELSLFAGPGWGGSCFPKDTRAVVKTGERFGVDLSIVRQAIEANERAKRLVPQRVIEFFNGNVEGKVIGLWGLAFKDKTDDVRESPALVIIDELTQAGATVVAYDPKANRSVQRDPRYSNNPRLRLVEHGYDAIRDADALAIATNWKEFSTPDFEMMKELLKSPVVFDGRDLYHPQAMKTRGFYYSSMGHRVVDGRTV